MSHRSPRIRTAAAAIALAVTLVPASVTAASAGTPESAGVPATGPLVTIDSTTTEAGFTHPGIGVTAASLENARSQVLKGAQPWTSYYDAMAASKYAPANLVSKNKSAVPDQPAQAYFTSTSTESKLIEDSWGAYTQALEYFITGQDVYRANAMKIIRIWSNMDPNQYAYYADSQIHTGVPLYRLLSAAEILRYTSYDPGYTDYDLAWHDSDTARLTTNLIDPMSKAFLYDNTHYYNQHSYPLIGSLAAYIFTDNRARYDQGVEWYTVNSTTTRPEQNGALAPIYPLISKDDPQNTYGYSFVQSQEMGRDQAHAGDDLDNLVGLARIISVQGTKVDPVHGTVSTERNAVDPYHFLGDRLLAGTDAYARFMLGHDTPWVDTTGGPGAISPGYRGRLYQIAEINELYDVYKYQEHVDVEKKAPSLATAHEQANGPLTYVAGSLYNTWGGIDTGPEYWLSLPRQLAGWTPPPATDSNVQVEQKGVALGHGTRMRTKDGRTYAEMHASHGGSTLVVHDLVYSDRSKYSPVGVMIRTTSSGQELAVARDQHTAPFTTIPLPNTRGQWRYVTYDVSNAAVLGSRVGDNIAYYTVTGKRGGTVDIDHVNTLVGRQSPPPVFAQGRSADVIGVTGTPVTASFAATDSNTAASVTYTAEGLPAGAQLDPATGRFSWTPTKKQAGDHHFLVVATDGTVDSVLDVTIQAEPDRSSAYRQALTGYDAAQTYTSASLAAFTAVSDQVEASIATATDADFAASLVALQNAVRSLLLLNPRLSDGTLDYAGSVTSPTLTPLAVGTMTDFDYNTFSGDLRAPFVLDFGAGFRVSATAFGIQARYNFANRSQGANVYGSDDGRNWTLLSSRETTDTTGQDFVMETIPAKSEVQDTRFRYFKVQVDDPGIPTDPAYPGLSDFSEFHITGTRYEVEQ